MLARILLSVLLVPSVVDCANLLVISNTPSYSHNIAFLEVWRQLQNGGHNITLVTTLPHLFESQNFTIIDVSTTLRVPPSEVFRNYSDISKCKMECVMWQISTELQDMLLNTSSIQDLLHGKYSFDAVVVELWYPALYTFSRFFNCPLVVFATIDVFEVLHWHMGNDLNHVTLPDMNSGLYQANNFFERVNSALYTTLEFLNHYFVVQPGQNGLIMKYFGDIGVSIKQLEGDIDLLLVNSHPIWSSVRAFGPTTVMVGGGNHIMYPQDLPQDLKSYLDNATEGFIYLSLGTIIHSSNVDANMLDVLVDVLSNLPYKVLWKIEDEHLQRKPKNVKTIKWGPQQDILRHPSIKLFISQGGIHSLEEALFCHVPILVMPFFGDQHKNGQLVTAKGIGRTIQHKPRLDKLELQSTIHELINNPKYKATAKRLSMLMNDTYMTGLEKSVWWIEYVIRNNGTKELRNPAAKLPFWQYYALDVIGFILFFLVVSIWLLVFIVKSILGIFTCDQVPDNKKKN